MTEPKFTPPIKKEATTAPAAVANPVGTDFKEAEHPRDSDGKFAPADAPPVKDEAAKLNGPTPTPLHPHHKMVPSEEPTPRDYITAGHSVAAKAVDVYPQHVADVTVISKPA